MITGFNPINSENSENLNYFASNNFQFGVGQQER